MDLFEEVTDFIEYSFNLSSQIQKDEQQVLIITFSTDSLEQVFAGSDVPLFVLVEKMIRLLKKHFKEIFDFDYLIETDQITLIPLL